MNNQQFNMQALASIDIQTVHKEDLVDVSGVTFDTSIPQDQRAVKVLQVTGNPYCFRVGDLGVKLEFLDNAPSLQETFFTFLQRKKSGI